VPLPAPGPPKRIKRIFSSFNIYNVKFIFKAVV
jgi:hypothetical protein